MAGFGPPRSSTRQPNRGLGTQPKLVLPSRGRQGDTPKWPLGGRPPKVWGELWELPQAVAWEQLRMERVVARYAQKLVRAEKPDAPAAILSEVRQLEDRLGMSPMAMLRLRWEIPAVAPPAAVEQVPAGEGEGAEVTQLDEYRDLYGDAPTGG